ncbi:hypothetical protein JI435_125060, partial [Parastagonospora nodorum SN15]
ITSAPLEPTAVKPHHHPTLTGKSNSLHHLETRSPKCPPPPPPLPPARSSSLKVASALASAPMTARAASFLALSCKALANDEHTA